ncbi:hypothetical protein ACO0LF_14600 [Undibacterium sp. Di27W]|uniref:hypothetical protein n=1 Tax=Undibacterium sp. Di27W TaxID=3413036 RepID=UPI003BF0429E
MHAVVSTPVRYAAVLGCMLASLSLTAGPAQAQSAVSGSTTSVPASASATEEPQSVEVKAIRDPAILPYKVAYEMITKVKAASKDKVEIIIRITAAKTHAVIPNLAIYLDSKDKRKKLEISAAGDVTVPLDPVAYAEGAEFVTNQKKGSMDANIMLLPKLPPDVFNYADISESLESARLAVKELVPWYLRLFMPTIHGVGICYPTQDQTVLVKGNEESQLPATSNETDMMKNKVYCAKFTTRDVVAAKNNLVMPAAGWQAIFF